MQTIVAFDRVAGSQTRLIANGHESNKRASQTVFGFQTAGNLAPAIIHDEMMTPSGPA